jgi:hypothetical protein
MTMMVHFLKNTKTISGLEKTLSRYDIMVRFIFFFTQLVKIFLSNPQNLKSNTNTRVFAHVAA